MPLERLLITVKTYPTLSRTYGETVCTAGIKSDGSWVRLYPVPFRRLDEPEQYKKFDWIDCDIYRNVEDRRIESYRLSSPDAITVMGHIGTDHEWMERRKLILGKCKVYRQLGELIDIAKSQMISLAVFKPAQILKFSWEEEEEKQWNEDKLREMRNRQNQGDLFEQDSWRQTFKIIPKLPYSFSYKFVDDDGRESEMKIHDWEIGQLYWNCRKTSQNEGVALEKVRHKYYEEFIKKDLHFFSEHQSSFTRWLPIRG